MKFSNPHMKHLGKNSFYSRFPLEGKNAVNGFAYTVIDKDKIRNHFRLNGNKHLVLDCMNDFVYIVLEI